MADDETPVRPESKQQLSNEYGGSQIQAFSVKPQNTSASNPGNSTESIDKYVATNGHLLRSGKLGMCNDPYCTTCPTYYKEAASRKPSTHSEPFHHSLYGNAARGWGRRILSYICHHIPGVMNPHAKFVQQWNAFFFISCLIAVFVDPLFFFLRSFKLNEMCVVSNRPMTITVVVLRTMTDFIFLLHILLQFRLAYIDPESGEFGAGHVVDNPKKIALNYLHGHFFLDLFIALPLPQIMILSVLPRMSESIVGNRVRNILQIAVLAPRLYKFLPLLAGRSPTGFMFESAWTNFVINLFTYMLSGHVIGSCWYLFGLQRVSRCLQHACATIHMCEFMGCGHVEMIPYLNSSKASWESWKNNANATNCFREDGLYYGIYRSAVNLTTQDSVTTRYIYSLFWGVQQISTLAGNLIPGYFVWEVLFTMAITAFGLFLFALLIGNMQHFLQALGRRKLEMFLRRHDVDQWMSHRRLPQEIRLRVFEAEKWNWAITRGINQERLLENLPEDLQIDIRRHLVKFLRVPIFELMDDPILDAICEKLRQRTFIVGSKIMNRDGVIERIIFIVQGKMQSVGEEGITDLSEGDVCGEELLAWCLDNCLRNKGRKKLNVPVLHSNRTVKCLTNVEAFALQASDLEEVIRRFARFLRSPQVQKAMRSASTTTRTEAGAWRSKKKCYTHPTPLKIAALQRRR